MTATVSPSVVPVAGAAFVRPIKAGDGVRLYGATSGSVGLKPAAAAGSVDFTLPAADGSSGHVLQTNGSAVLSFAQVAHSALSGLTGDDHTQYLLLAGRSGGQTVFGGGATASDVFTLNVNTHAAPTGTMRLAHTGGDIWIGRNASTAVKLKLFEATGSGNHSTSFEAQNQSADISYILPATSANGWLANTSGTLSWTYPGSDTQVVYNDGGTPTGDASLIWDKTNNRLGIGDTTAAASPDKHLHVATTTSTEGIELEFANDNSTIDGQILLRRARGNYTTLASAFSGDPLNKIVVEAHDGSAYRMAAEISFSGLTNPAAAQTYFPGKVMVKCGSYSSASLITCMVLQGGNAAFTAAPRVIFGDGAVEGGEVLEVTASATNHAACAMQNTAGSATFGIDTSGRFQLTKSKYISNTTRMVMTSTQIHLVQDTNVYGLGEVVVEGDGTATLFGVCRQATPAGNIAITICDWSTNQHTKIYDHGGAEFNIQQNNADFIIHGDTTSNVFFMDASAEAVGIGIAAPLAKLHVDQTSTTGAKPVLTLDQADVDEDFFKFIGTSDTSADRALVDAANFTTAGTIKGWLKINIQDDQATDPIVDGDYYIPFYSVPTA